MTYFQEIQQQLENGQSFMNDSDEGFTWTTFTRNGDRQIHIYKGEDFEIRKYKTSKSFSIAVGRFLNGAY